MIPCKQLLEFDLEMVSNFSENANILEYEIKFEKNLKACDWSVWTGCRGIACSMSEKERGGGDGHHRAFGAGMQGMKECKE